MRKTLAALMIVGAMVPAFANAAGPVRPGIAPMAAGKSLGGIDARVGAPTSNDSHIAGGSAFLIAGLAAAAVAGGVYAGVHHSHNRAVSPG